MTAIPAANPGETLSVLPMPGLEVDNLLSILALLGVLRSLEAENPAWHPRVSWSGPPWVARLHLDARVTEEDVAKAAAKGIERVAARFDVDGRKNVDFEPEQFREYAKRCRADPVRAALATALTVEFPRKQDGGLRAAPLVMMFGQGHQNFLERLVAIALGSAPRGLAKAKTEPDLRNPRYVAKALFQPWKRDDDCDGFRWDPEEDQRYALRFGDPSRAGAASTVHGANRLATLGLLSFPSAPSIREPNLPPATACRAPGSPTAARGSIREPNLPPATASANGIAFLFVWPVWTEPLSLHGIERFMCHPDVVTLEGWRKPSPLGIAEVYVARRIANGKFMNVTRGVPRARRS